MSKDERQPEISLTDMADDMQVNLYGRYSAEEAAQVIGISEKELEELRTEGRIAYLQLSKQKIGFFGCQLLTYLRQCIVPESSQSSEPERSEAEADAPTINPSAELLSVNETMSLIGVGRTKLYELINEKQLKVLKIGNRTKIVRSSVKKFIHLDQ